ncbi:MAG: hypothetical protein J3K34DRAFT_415590 [Monoraphidium minutum]|nr:MAG: hypothetical protein J3K34DRAFT_415590 [Monoraphidium minutum]
MAPATAAAAAAAAAGLPTSPGVASRPPAGGAGAAGLARELPPAAARAMSHIPARRAAAPPATADSTEARPRPPRRRTLGVGDRHRGCPAGKSCCHDAGGASACGWPSDDAPAKPRRHLQCSKYLRAAEVRVGWLGAGRDVGTRGCAQEGGLEVMQAPGAEARL